MSSSKEKPIEVNYKILLTAIILFILIGLGFLMFFNNYVEELKEIQKNPVSICEELNKNNSKYVKHIGDALYINGKKYNYQSISLQCQLKLQNETRNGTN